MNENKRLITVGVGLVVIVALIFLISFWPKADKSFVCGIKADGDYKKIGAVNYKQYQCLIKEKGKNALVVDSKMTTKKKKVLNEAAKSIGHSVYYLNFDKISDKDLKTIKKKLKYQDKSFDKDVILVIQKGKVKDYKEEITAKADEVKNFLKEAKLGKFVCGAAPMEEYENLGLVTYDQYQCLYESTEPFAIVFSQTTCGYCQKFKPVINEYVGKNNIPLYVIEINTLEDNDRQALLGSLSYFDDNESWGTPLTLGIKNKEVVTQINGFTDDTDEIDEFFETMGLK